ncbi:MAG TPA: hypothetical protein VGD67_16375, partial [Pseudonocardiaceae bacterium]
MPTPAGHRVRLADGRTIDAEVVWRGDPAVLDVALLAIAEPLDTPPARFGDLTAAAGRPEFTAVGFPAFAERSGRRESKRVDGTVQLGSYHASGLLDLSIGSAAPRDTRQDPWRGFSGAAVRVGDLVVGVVSRRLPAAGTTSADATDVGAALADPVFRRLVEDAGCVVLPVRAPEPAAVLEHRRMVAGLSGLRRNLTSEYLPFVEPGEHESSPAALLRRLDTDADRGVVLVGAAGSGKSRTCFEVARLAEEAGWRAVHVLPGEPLATYEQVSEAVLAGRAPTLVILDYLNEYRGLDPASLCSRLIPEARGHGIRVAVLASARPGWLLRAEAAYVQRGFDQVPLRTDVEHQAAIRQSILTSQAPRALDALGPRWLAAACGKRPVIAMLIARAVELRLDAGLPVDTLAGVREGDLLGWLDSRLAEDELTVPRPASPFDLTVPSPQLQAIVALVTACPQPRAEVEAAAVRTLGGGPSAAALATHLLDVVIGMGWVESEEDRLVATHDIVVDHLLEQVLLSQPGDRVRADVAGAVLRPCRTSARTCGRYVTHLTRLLRDLDLEERGAGLAEFCAAWLDDALPDVSVAMREDPAAATFALSALLDGPPWAEVAERRWSELFTPWLAAHGDDVHVRHLFGTGLRRERATKLVPAALEWVRAHLDSLGARSVLLALLARPDLGPLEPTAVALAVDWAGECRRTEQAHAVFQQLLGRTDLPRDAVTRLASYAEDWLAAHGTKFSANFVLKALLARPDLPAATMTATVRHAVAWFDGRGIVYDANFVLRALLDRPDLPPDVLGTALRHSETWLRQRGTVPEAGFLLKGMLARPDLPPSTLRAVERHALTWLDHHASTAGADFVLTALLGRPDLDDAAARATLAHANRWLDHHATTLDASFVLGALLTRPDLTTAIPAPTTGQQLPPASPAAPATSPAPPVAVPRP